LLPETGWARGRSRVRAALVANSTRRAACMHVAIHPKILNLDDKLHAQPQNCAVYVDECRRGLWNGCLYRCGGLCQRASAPVGKAIHPVMVSGTTPA
jgi:hypothetical protein